MSQHFRGPSGLYAEQDPWCGLLHLSREEPARRFLETAYARAGTAAPKRDAFRNAEPLSALIRQAESVFRSPVPHSPWLEPMLLYYGTMSLMKAWILSRKPEYPESTSVLRHGLSTRKRKKDPYCLFDDEVKVQKEGLFPLAARLMGAAGCIGETFKFRDLAATIADLAGLHARMTGRTPLTPVIHATERDSGTMSGESESILLIPETVLDRMNLTPAALARRITREAPAGTKVAPADPPVSKGWVRLAWRTEEGSGAPVNGRFRHPALYENERGDHYLWLGNDRPVTPVPELLSQFMLLFSLCMLCRYDPPLWGEIALGTIRGEGIWVRQFLDQARRRVPRLILRELQNGAELLPD